MAARILNLYNSFTRQLKPVELSNKIIDSTNTTPIIASLYVCGPTVYANCHVGHAINYIRLDLFRKFMKSMFNVKLVTVMNITDIDDKILQEAKSEFPSEVKRFESLNCDKDIGDHPYKKITEKYFASFLEDLDLIRVDRADLYLKVTDHIHIITDFIGRLEKTGKAYIAPNKDIYFDTKSLRGYVGMVDPRQEMNSNSLRPSDSSQPNVKRNAQDFVLWKSRKPGEPFWPYHSKVMKKYIYGRPGWHVQCSALANAMFQEKLDFHYGGKDLFFPHHYNEIACSCSFNDNERFDTNWSSNWLHSGHLVIEDTKMSKSLGNVIQMRDFMQRSSLNALRLLCVNNHYRADINYSQELLKNLMKIDHKLNSFLDYLLDNMKNISSGYFPNVQQNDDICNYDLHTALEEARNEMFEGICDDFNLAKGLGAILTLSKKVYSCDIKLVKISCIIAIYDFVTDWCDNCGLEYAQSKKSNVKGLDTLELLSSFRDKIRNLAIKELKYSNNNSHLARDILSECDSVRSKLDSDFGKVLRDTKTRAK